MRTTSAIRLATILVGTLAATAPIRAATARPDFSKVPGVVIDHSPQSSGLYIGSPGLTVLTNGDYLASHDFFGPKSAEFARPVTVVFRSSDRGRTWRQTARLEGLFWASLFTHQGAAWLLGTDKHHGRINIRRSTDGGVTWTEPRDTATGLLTPSGEYHTAPVPVVLDNGRLWRATEDAMGGVRWGERYRAFMLSVPAEADLLQATNWTFSNPLARDPKWLDGDFGAWLEGNAVVTRDGRVFNILRVQSGMPERAAIVSVSPDGKTASFDPQRGFIQFPGGAKKFSIRFDRPSDLYWSLSTMVPPQYQKAGPPGSIRNTLALVASPDLTNWTVRSILLHHPDTARHGFQYVDWQFDGDDMIAACRTAFDDGLEGAHNNHDANFLTFHRIANFRNKTSADSVPMASPAQTRVETADLEITGSGWTMKRVGDDERAFSNRSYVWKNIPAEYRGWQFTQTAGGEPARITVKARRTVTLHVATTPAQKKVNLDGWTVLPAATFHYTDAGATKMGIVTRTLQGGESVVIPQGNWTGGILLVPPDTTSPASKGAGDSPKSP